MTSTIQNFAHVAVSSFFSFCTLHRPCPRSHQDRQPRCSRIFWCSSRPHRHMHQQDPPPISHCISTTTCISQAPLSHRSTGSSSPFWSWIISTLFLLSKPSWLGSTILCLVGGVDKKSPSKVLFEVFTAKSLGHLTLNSQHKIYIAALQQSTYSQEPQMNTPLMIVDMLISAGHIALYQTRKHQSMGTPIALGTGPSMIFEQLVGRVLEPMTHVVHMAYSNQYSTHDMKAKLLSSCKQSLLMLQFGSERVDTDMTSSK